MSFLPFSRTTDVSDLQHCDSLIQIGRIDFMPHKIFVKPVIMVHVNAVVYQFFDLQCP